MQTPKLHERRKDGNPKEVQYIVVEFCREYRSLAVAYMVIRVSYRWPCLYVYITNFDNWVYYD